MSNLTNRKAYIYICDIYCGVLEEVDSGYQFTYDDKYVENEDKPVSLTMPLNKKCYKSKTLFSFFDGLLPEGYLLESCSKELNIPINDRFGLLLRTCKDSTGNVSVRGVK